MPNKIKIPVFRVTQPYLSLMVKPGFFFQVFWKKYNFMHFERRKVIFFPEKINKIIYSQTSIIRSARDRRNPFE